MRIISLVPSVTETLFELGLDDQIVGITRWCTRPADKVAKKSKVGGTKNPKLRSIVELKPDVVILDCDENRKEDAEELERVGVRTFSVFPKTVQDSIQMVRDLGAYFGVSTKAEAMAAEMEDRIKNDKPERTYRSLILIWRAPYMTVNGDTYADSASRLFGFENVFANHAQRYPRLTPGEVEQSNSEVVLFPDEPYPFRPKHLERFRTEFPHLPASESNKFLLFDGSYIAWHGYGTLRALRDFPAAIKAAQLP